jgi:hypothetical protein
VGEGLFEFGDAEEAEAAIEAINADYPRQSRAARRMAAEYFSSDRVISSLMAEAGLS